MMRLVLFVSSIGCILSEKGINTQLLEVIVSDIIGDAPCPNCRKLGRDKTGEHLILFEDGGAFCNRCGYREAIDTHTVPTSATITGEKSEEQCKKEVEWVRENTAVRGLKERGIKQFVCEHYGVRVGLSFEDGITPVCTYFPVSDGTAEKGYRFKSPDKRMGMKGSGKDAHFFGAHVVARKGKKLFITEGQEDCLALYQTLYEYMDPKYRRNINVVSLQNGAGSSAKELVRNAELCRGYKEIVLCFDMDKAGADAVSKVLTVVPRDKVRVVKMNHNDANACVLAGESKDLYFNAIQADSPRPEKIVCGVDLEDMLVPLKKGLSTPFPVLNTKLHGMRFGPGGGELTVWCAGSGIGKSTCAREVCYVLNKQYQKRIGHIFLEEQKTKTAQAYIAMDNHVPLAALREDPTVIPRAAFAKSHEELINNGRCFFFNHWGSINSRELMDHMYHFSQVEKCDFIILDHISLVISGEQSSSEGERKDLDVLMTKLASFCEESGTSVQAVVHLKRPATGSFNDGQQVSLSHLRGSAAIEQLSHNVIAIEGDQHGDSPHTRHLRVLKNREWGDVGLADELIYNHETGRLLPEEDVSYEVGLRG